MSSKLVLMDVQELAAVVREQVASALAEYTPRPASPTPLFDRSKLAKALDCSTRTVDRMLARGLPHVMVGDSPRFDFDRVLEWLNGEQHAEVAGSRASHARENASESAGCQRNSCSDVAARTGKSAKTHTSGNGAGDRP